MKKIISAWLYIPKLSELIENTMVNDAELRAKVLNVLKNCGYEKILD